MRIKFFQNIIIINKDQQKIDIIIKSQKKKIFFKINKKKNLK